MDRSNGHVSGAWYPQDGGGKGVEMSRLKIDGTHEEKGLEAYNRGLELASRTSMSLPALLAFRKATILDPSNPLYALELTLALYDAGLRSQAMEQGLAAIILLESCGPIGDPYTASRAGLVCAMILEDNSKALQYFTSAYSLGGKDDIDHLINYAISLKDNGMREEAATLAERSTSSLFDDPNTLVTPEDASKLAHLAHLMVDLDEQKALECIKKALVAAPDDPYVRQSAGAISLEIGFFEDSAEHYRKAKEASPNWPLAWGGWQHALLCMGLFEDAIEIGHEILKRWPDFSEVRFNTAAASLDSGRYEEAEREFIEYLSHNQEDAHAHAALGLAYASQGRATDARREQARALELDGDNPEIKKASDDIDRILDGGGVENEDKLQMAFILMTLFIGRTRKRRSGP